MISWENVRDYVGTNDSEQDVLESSTDLAIALVDQFISTAWRIVPESVRDQAVLDTAAEVYTRSNTSNEPRQYSDGQGQALARGPRDPMSRVYPILRKYVSHI